MSLLQSLIGTHVIETANSYARADDPLQHPTQLPTDSGPKAEAVATDGGFWDLVFKSPSSAWNTTFLLDHFRLSEWVARVPGLVWTPESEVLRDSFKNAKKDIGGYAYPPPQRSARVMGGVGTLRLPPGDDGTRLATLVRNADVAEGVPVRMSDDVWDYIKRDGSIEGCVISGAARWVPMSQQWTTNFPVIRGLPRGYLELKDPGSITLSDDREETYIAPFSIMEYESGASELFDYVYVGVLTGEKDYRKQVEDFFDRYRKDVSPHARYLIAGDMVQPMWEAEFLSPAELRRLDAGAKSQLSLLEARVRERMLGKHAIEPLLQKMGDTIREPDELKVISDEIQLKAALWFAGGSLAEQISQFLDKAVEHKKLDELIVRLAARHPRWFVNQGKE